MSELSHEDVQQILATIDKAQYDYFELKSGDLTLVVSKNGPAPAARSSSNVAPTPATNTPATPPVPAPAASPAAPVSHEGLVAVPSPMVGTFYAQSEPGAPPYVSVGSTVGEDTTMGLIEVMKVYTAVRAGIRGTVAEVLVQNAQFVEYGQPLFYVLPAS